MNPLRLIGYTDVLSTAPGCPVRFMVSADLAHYDAEIVRLIDAANGDSSSYAGERPISTHISGRYAGAVQGISTGSYVEVPSHDALNLRTELTIQAWIYPTTPGNGRQQGIITRLSNRTGRPTGYALAIEADGTLSFRVSDYAGCTTTAVARSARLRPREWYFVAAQYDACAGVLRLRQEPLSIWLRCEGERVEQPLDVELGSIPAPLLIGAYFLERPGHSTVSGNFNGKIGNPSIWSRTLSHGELDAIIASGSASRLSRAELVAAWDFGCDVDTNRIVDHGPFRLHGIACNCPARAVTGHKWTGLETDFRRAPDQYGAIHFHHDDLEDARWTPAFELIVPELASGVYAARLSGGGSHDYVPFFVRPKLGRPRAAIGLLIPTLTYVAYGNTRLDERLLAVEATIQGRSDFQFDRHELYVRDHPELGMSLYNEHADGSLCSYSSRLRPIVEMRPGYRYCLSGGVPRHFAADLHLIGWLERRRTTYDVFTDEDLHHFGVELLQPYRVVITGSHPEYCTSEMLSAIGQYIASGGRLMYLGGNGFYWVTTIAKDRPHLIEVRRGHAGTRTGNSGPGEGHHSTTGEPGGLWRFRGRPPNKLVGVGFSAQGGATGGAGYTRLPDSFSPRAAFVFDGIGDDETIGEFGPLGGAASDEVDRADELLGTPEDALVLATSAQRHSDQYQVAIEDVTMMLPEQGGTQNPKVRSDLVLLNTPAGGAVFAVGSIGWTLCLRENAGRNNVARVTANVLDQFAAD